MGDSGHVPLVPLALRAQVAVGEVWTRHVVSAAVAAACRSGTGGDVVCGTVCLLPVLLLSRTRGRRR